MKSVFYILVISGTMFIGLYLALNSDDVRASQYQSCMVTSTDKEQCKVFVDEADITIYLAEGVSEDDIRIETTKDLYFDIKR